MKAHILLLIALWVVGAAQAQVHYYHSTAAPWDGDELFSLHVGTRLQPDASTAFQSTPTIPLAVSLRYDGEKAFGPKWVLGFQTELGYTRSRTSHTFDGDCPPSFVTYPSAGQWLHYSSLEWDIAVEGRILAGFYLSESVQLHAAAGFYENLLSSRSLTTYTTDKRTNADSPAVTSGGKPSLGLDVGFCAAAGVSYYFSDNLYTVATAKLHIPFNWGFDERVRTNAYSFMLGIGYKFIR